MYNLQMLTLNFKSYEDQLFYIVTFVYWNIVYVESCVYKSVLGKINKLQNKIQDKITTTICKTLTIYQHEPY